MTQPFVRCDKIFAVWKFVSNFVFGNKLIDCEDGRHKAVTQKRLGRKRGIRCHFCDSCFRLLVGMA